jgi:hypothetical protein
MHEIPRGTRTRIPDIIIGILLHSRWEGEGSGREIGGAWRKRAFWNGRWVHGGAAGGDLQLFKVLAEFAEGLKNKCGCELNLSKCKMYSVEGGACERARRRGHIRVASPTRGDIRQRGRRYPTGTTCIQRPPGGGEVCHSKA